jgi:hypothetical protein
MGWLSYEIPALALSAAIEGPVGALVVRAARWPSRGLAHVAGACAVATAVTHPQLWAAAEWAYPRFGYWQSLAALEGAVVLAEGALIAWMAGLRLHRAMLVSLAANAVSCAVGLALG